MSKQLSNPCTRCGQERIEAKTWTEEVETFFGSSTITHTDMVCPNPECQEIVQEKLDQQKVKTENIRLEREERMKNNQNARKANAKSNLT